MRIVSIITAVICSVIGVFSLFVFAVMAVLYLPLLFGPPEALLFFGLFGLYLVLAFTPLVLLVKSRKSQHPQLYFVSSLLIGAATIALFWLYIGKILPTSGH
jgi:hypothetical protein